MGSTVIAAERRCGLAAAATDGRRAATTRFATSEARLFASTGHCCVQLPRNVIEQFVRWPAQLQPTMAVGDCVCASQVTPQPCPSGSFAARLMCCLGAHWS